MDPERLSEWQAVIRDFAIVALAAFAIIFGIVAIHEPTVLGIVLGTGCTLLGVPAAIRADASRRKKRENGNGDDRWSHLP